MLKSMLTRVPRSLGRRKIETLTLSAIAALSAVGIARQDGESAPLAAVSTAVRKPAEVLLSSSIALSAKSTTGASSNVADLRMIAHPKVESWIKQFTTSQRGSMATYLSRMTKYEDMISTKLASKGMPQGLIYLALIESGFNPTAKSPVKARGLWQFMTGTGKQYGLTVNRKVDERTNPSKATDAALDYLSDLYDRFGSWYLAAAAYNSGPGTVSKALRKVTGRTKGTDADFYRILPKLPRETREYVPKLIAAARIGENPARYGFSD